MQSVHTCALQYHEPFLNKIQFSFSFDLLKQTKGKKNKENIKSTNSVLVHHPASMCPMSKEVQDGDDSTTTEKEERKIKVHRSDICTIHSDHIKKNQYRDKW